MDLEGTLWSNGFMHIDAPHRGRDSKRQFKRTSVNMIPVYLKFKKQTSESAVRVWRWLSCVFAAKGKSSGGVKTAKLYAWVALQTLPEEMVISPCLLDFLEKALETIPITPVDRNYTGVFLKPVLWDSVLGGIVCLDIHSKLLLMPFHQLWHPRRKTWVSLIQWNSSRNRPPPWFPLQRRHTPPSPWMWLSTSESRYWWAVIRAISSELLWNLSRLFI